MVVVIIDYGVGNVSSIKNMLKRIGCPSLVSSDVKDIEGAEKIILPGVGAFDTGISNLIRSGLLPMLERKVLREKTDILGICLGMQLFAKTSEEGKLPGLGWINAQTIRFKSNDKSLKIPHMGWNTLNIKDSSNLLANLPKESRFYFVHSYHVTCKDTTNVLCTTSYGIDFNSAVHKENIYGVQFHPEKSHRYGMQLLRNFVEL